MRKLVYISAKMDQGSMGSESFDFTGAVREAHFTRPVWCGGCDWK